MQRHVGERDGADDVQRVALIGTAREDRFRSVLHRLGGVADVGGASPGEVTVGGGVDLDRVFHRSSS